MKIGNLVRRTYGEGNRPIGIVVGNSSNDGHSQWWVVRWNNSPKGTDHINEQYLEVLNESR